MSRQAWRSYQGQRKCDRVYMRHITLSVKQTEEKMILNKPARKKRRTAEVLAWGEACKAVFWPTQSCKRKPLMTVGFQGGPSFLCPWHPTAGKQVNTNTHTYRVGLISTDIVGFIYRVSFLTESIVQWLLIVSNSIVMWHDLFILFKWKHVCLFMTFS